MFLFIFRRLAPVLILRLSSLIYIHHEDGGSWYLRKVVIYPLSCTTQHSRSS